MSHAFVVLYTLALFGGMLFVSAELLGRIDLKQINLLLYFLAVFMAGLVSFRSDHDAKQNSELTSFRWVSAVRLANYQTWVLSLVLFAIVFLYQGQGNQSSVCRLLYSGFLADSDPAESLHSRVDRTVCISWPQFGTHGLFG